MQQNPHNFNTAYRSGQAYVPLEFSLLEKHLPTASRVLDFGGGDGTDALQFAERGHVVEVVDSSEEAIRCARPHQNISYSLGDEHCIPDKNYDLIILKHVLAFIPLFNRSNLLRFLRGHLTANGKLLLVTPIWQESYSAHDKEISIKAHDILEILQDVFPVAGPIGVQINSRGIIAHYYLCS